MYVKVNNRKKSNKIYKNLIWISYDDDKWNVNILQLIKNYTVLQNSTKEKLKKSSLIFYFGVFAFGSINQNRNIIFDISEGSSVIHFFL